MSDRLREICAAKRGHVAARRRAAPEAGLLARAAALPPCRGFAAALRAAVDAGGWGLIAEIKRASPSRGRIREDFDPAALARAYRAGGAACLSVLTDAPFFEGRDEHLAAAREAAPLPALRKDFLVDPYQVAESRALGADCALLILAALDDPLARELRAAARELGMDVLAEVHDPDELGRALDLDPDLVGINNRDLRTLEVDLATGEALARELPAGCEAVAESGLARAADLERMAAAGVRRFLVGESLMREADVEAATRRLLGAAPAPADA